MIHGENDGWPGLVLDRYAHTFVAKLYSAAWLPRWADLSGLLQRALLPLLPPSSQATLVLRLSRNIQETARTQHNLQDGQIVWGQLSSKPETHGGQVKPGFSLHPGFKDSQEQGAGDQAKRRSAVDHSVGSPDLRQGSLPDQPQPFLESGLHLEAEVRRGQKTGFYLDQRENRRRIEPLAAGRHVLNAFSFTGGFSLYAARGGAASVTDLDISEHALAGSHRHFLLHQTHPAIAHCPHHLVQADAFDWLAQPRPPAFDLIILDPPSLARREADRPGAIRAYDHLTTSALRHLRPHGTLFAASCSAHVSSTEFFHAVRDAARRSRRPFRELATTGHPPDHPATFPEAHYLKGIYLQFEP